MLHSTQDPTVQAFTEQNVEGSLDVNNLVHTGGNNIFNSLSEKKKELSHNFPSQESSTPGAAIKPKSISNSQTFSQHHNAATVGGSGIKANT